MPSDGETHLDAVTRERVAIWVAAAGYLGRASSGGIGVTSSSR
jgi:hypothetical protein